MTVSTKFKQISLAYYNVSQLGVSVSQVSSEQLSTETLDDKRDDPRLLKFQCKNKILANFRETLM